MATGREIMMEKRREIVEAVIKDMEQGGLSWKSNWKSVFDGRFYNPVTKCRYKGCNIWHLGFATMMNGYSSPMFMTMNQIRKAGYKLRKGAQGTKVECYKNRTISVDVVDGDTGETTTENHTYLCLVGYYIVFNGDDIEGIDEDDASFAMPVVQIEHTDDETLHYGRLLAESSACPVRHKKVLRAPCYMPLMDVIDMPFRRQFRADKDYIATLAHEMVHSTGHWSRLNREQTMQRKGYAFEELVAELGAMFVCHDLGFGDAELGEEHRKNHAAYLQSWLHALNDDTDYLFRASTLAHKAAEYIMERYAAHVDGTEKAA